MLVGGHFQGSQGYHGASLLCPVFLQGPPPTFDGTSFQAHQRAMSLSSTTKKRLPALLMSAYQYERHPSNILQCDSWLGCQGILTVNIPLNFNLPMVWTREHRWIILCNMIQSTHCIHVKKRWFSFS